MNNVKNVGRLATLAARQLHSTKQLQIHNTAFLKSLSPEQASKLKCDNSHLPELRAKQERFQRDDGLPVYLKGGMKDRVFFGITLALIAYGFVDGGIYMYEICQV